MQVRHFTETPATLPEVAVLTTDRAARASISSAVGAMVRLRYCTDDDELYQIVRSSATAVVVIELGFRRYVNSRALVERVHATSPDATIVGYCWLQRGAAAEIIAAAEGGLSALILRGIDDPGATVRAALAARRTACHATRVIDDVLRAVPGVVSDQTAALLTRIVHDPRSATSVSEIARAVGVARKTVLRRFVRERLLPPAMMLPWLRLLCATRALEGSTRRVAQVAADFGFGSARAFRTVSKRYAGVQPVDLRRPGAYDDMLARFTRAARLYRATAAGRPASDGPAGREVGDFSLPCAG